jgi:hypothetical protein
MPFDKRECPNGHGLLWQNPQTITRHAAADRIRGDRTSLTVSARRFSRLPVVGVCPLLFHTVSVLD